MKYFLLLCSLSFAFAQGLFESATQTASLNYDLNGSIKLFSSLTHTNDSLEFNNIYSRSALNIKVVNSPSIYAFTNIIFTQQSTRSETTHSIIMRECFIDVSLKSFNARIGKQILPWGQADMYKATDNITPQDLRYFYPDRNDMRLGNFLLNAKLNLSSSLNFQGIVIPDYSPNLLPLSLFDLPDNISYSNMEKPSLAIKNTGIALKLDLRNSHYDLSLSYVNAYALQPALASSYTFISPTDVNYTFFLEPWRQQVVGFNAAYNLNDWATRFEAAYMKPDKNSTLHYTPESQLQLSLGLDKTSGPLTLLCEYNVNIVPHLTILSTPANPLLLLEYNLIHYNRLFYRQSEQVSHNIFLYTSLDLFHETLKLEFPLAYNISTKDYLLSTQLEYQLADAFEIKIGAQKYAGQENSLFDLLKPLYNGFYMQLKLSF